MLGRDAAKAKLNRDHAGQEFCLGGPWMDWVMDGKGVQEGSIDFQGCQVSAMLKS